ncbi:MAG: bifunctional DNA primase/polymerase [Planctomycetes bacterium]|nr:bifunctional DNA primase/polymerase [Planctomycetota bacterium]
MPLRLLATQSILKAALCYDGLGWWVIPIKPGSKKAACSWKRYQHSRPKPGALRQWFTRRSAYGVAVVLGNVSGCLACRDFDRAEAYECWAGQHPDLARLLPTVRTGRGYHV